MSAENIRTVTPKSAIAAIKTALKVRRPVMIHGAPGIGKSDIIHQIGKELNRPVIDIRLALYDPSDIKGFPYFDPKSQSMKWAASSELPKDEFSNAIVFYDELVSAAPAVQGAAYKLILNRRVGEYHYQQVQTRLLLETVQVIVVLFIRCLHHWLIALSIWN